jgi:hypothetical protein
MNVEWNRIIHEWKARLRQIKEILNPPPWNSEDWKVFATCLAILVQRHGYHWRINGTLYWDLRWAVREGGELVCQVEQIPDQSIALTVAQVGGFAGDKEPYIWMWTVFDPDGNYIRDPFWVDGIWKDALVGLLLPYASRAGYYLGERTETPNSNGDMPPPLEQGIEPVLMLDGPASELARRRASR